MCLRVTRIQPWWADLECARTDDPHLSNVVSYCGELTLASFKGHFLEGGRFRSEIQYSSFDFSFNFNP